MKKILRVLAKGIKKHWRIVVVAVLIVAAVSGYLVWRSQQDKKLDDQRKAVITYSADKPEEEKPDKNTYKWYGYSEDPKYITLPSIGAEGFIQKVGVDQRKEVAVPSNIHIGGWFVDTVRPGQKGLSIIDGHVSGYDSDGVFKNLINVKPNDRFTVEFGDGSKKDFRIKSVKSVKTAEAAGVLFSQEPGITNQLSLITCGGKFDRATNQFEERVIAVAEAI